MSNKKHHRYSRKPARRLTYKAISSERKKLLEKLADAQENKLSYKYDDNPDLAVAVAKELYFRYFKKSQICEITGLRDMQIDYYCYKGKWAKERDLLEQNIISEITRDKKIALEDVAQLSIDLIRRGLLHLRDSESPLSPKDISQVATVLSAIDKVWRLETNRPTEIQHEKAVTKDDIRDLIKELDKLDDFADYLPKEEEKADEPPPEPVTH